MECVWWEMEGSFWGENVSMNRRLRKYGVPGEAREGIGSGMGGYGWVWVGMGYLGGGGWG